MLGLLITCFSIAAAGEGSGSAQESRPMALVVFPEAAHRALTDRERWVTEVMVSETVRVGEGTRFAFIPYRLSMDEVLLAFNVRAAKEGESLQDQLIGSGIGRLIELRLGEHELVLTRYDYVEHAYAVTTGTLRLAHKEQVDTDRLKDFVHCHILFGATSDDVARACASVLRSPSSSPTKRLVATMVGGEEKTPVPAPSKKTAKKMTLKPLWVAAAIVGSLSLPALVLGVVMGVGSIMHGLSSFLIWTALDRRADGAGLRPESAYRERISMARNLDMAMTVFGGGFGVLLLSAGVVAVLVAVGLVVRGFVS